MTQTIQNVAAIGLGSMGYGIAASALRGGHKVWGVDINPDQMAKFVSDGGQDSDLARALDQIDTAIIAVLNAAQTEDVLFGAKGLVPSLKKGAAVLACATVPPAFAKDMAARCAEYGVLYLDAPISGGSVKAAKGELSIMAAGSPSAFEALAPVLDSISETVFELGDQVGAGVTPDSFIEVISKCAGSSWMLENRAPHIAAGDYTPHSSVNIWPKDLGIVLDIAQSAGFDAPIATAALDQFRAAADMGLGHEDDAAVAKVYASKVGIDLPAASKGTKGQ